MGNVHWSWFLARKKSAAVWLSTIALVAVVGVPNVRSHIRHNRTEDLNQSLLQLSNMPEPLRAKEQYQAALQRAQGQLDQLMQTGFSEEYLAEATKAVQSYGEAYDCYARDKVSSKVQDVSESMTGFVFAPDEVYGPAGKMKLSKERGKKLLVQAANHSQAFDKR